MNRAAAFVICMLLIGVSFLPSVGVAQAQEEEECADHDIRTIKYERTADGSFTEAWNLTFDGGFDDRSAEVAVDAADNVYVLGTSHNGVDDDFRLLMYNADGVLQWELPYDAGGNERGYMVSVDSNGFLYAVGTHVLGTTNTLLLVKFSTDGVFLWSQHYESGSLEQASGAVADEAGNVYVAGVRYTAAPDADRFLVKYDSVGNLLWDIRDYRAGRDRDGDIVRDSAGNLYVTGFLDDQFRTTKYDENGVTVWDRVYNPGVYDYADDIDIDSAGNVYVAGVSTDNYSYIDSVLLKYDNAGNLQWDRRYNSSKPEGVAVGINDDVYIAAHTRDPGLSAPSIDLHAVQFDSTGSQGVVLPYDSGSEDGSGGIAVDGAGNLLVIGHSLQCSLDPPIADLGGPYLGSTGAPMAFDGSASSDPDGGALIFEWDFGDGATGDYVSPSHTYAAAGIYEVCLTVIDPAGLSDTDCTDAIVYDPAGGWETGGGSTRSDSFAFFARYTDDGLSGKLKYVCVDESGSAKTFWADAYDWMVIVAPSAELQGSGHIVGDSGEYGFLLSTLDEKYSADHTKDQLGIEIWAQDDPEDPICAVPLADIDGGKIALHGVVSAATSDITVRVAGDPPDEVVARMLDRSVEHDGMFLPFLGR